MAKWAEQEWKEEEKPKAVKLSKEMDELWNGIAGGKIAVSASNVLREAAELKDMKSKDYQGGKWTEDDYFPFGDKSYIHMIHTKYLRMRNIAEGDQETHFEALDDTLIDMAVYCCMYAAKIRRDEAANHDEELAEFLVDQEEFKKMRGYTQD